MSTEKYENQQFVLASRPRPGVLQINLNRPRARNALSKKLLAEVAGILKIASEDPEIRCIVLTGNNEAFSAGADIKEMPEEGIPMFADTARLTAWKAIEQFRKPIVAAVNGYALGGGCELALLCDFVI